jgi:hypothetical protein
MDFSNATQLSDQRLQQLFERHTAPFRHDRLTVRVRYSRGADFSGTCFYREGRIFVNLGRHLRFPYRMNTHLAKAQTRPGYWFRDSYTLTLRDAYQLALFIYLHELYHYLVKAAGRGVRRKEAMCDRFAAKILVDEYGVRLTDSRGRTPDRGSWDFKDLYQFVAAAPQATPPEPARVIPVRILGLPVRSASRRPR